MFRRLKIPDCACGAASVIPRFQAAEKSHTNSKVSGTLIIWTLGNLGLPCNFQTAQKSLKAQKRHVTRSSLSRSSSTNSIMMAPLSCAAGTDIHHNNVIKITQRTFLTF